MQVLSWFNRFGGHSMCRFALAATVSLALLSMTGCGGCFQKDGDDPQTAEEKRQEEEKKRKKPDFESLAPMAMPAILNDPVKVKRRQSRVKNDPVQLEIAKLVDFSRKRHKVKSGHWHDVKFQVIANNFDFQGELDTSAVGSNGPVRIPSTDFHAKFNRPVALSKGEWKTLESSVFLPIRNRDIKSQQFQCEINRRGGRLSTLINSNLPARLLPHQHHVVLLSSNPDAYRFLDLAPTVRIPSSTTFGEALPEAYVVVPSMPGMPVPLPRHPLNWTTIAYLIWDDLDPDLLDQSQQESLIDWLHFGGQLVLSGPDCLERLETSFLADYLPARADTAKNLVADDIQELNQNWSLPEKNAEGKTRDLLLSDKLTLLGTTFLPHETAQELAGTGGMVVERQLGRGRIVATAFSLKAPAVRSWRSFDSFLNGALLRRPGRTFYKADQYDSVSYRWLGDQASPTDPLLHTTLRYLSRDLGERATSKISPETAVVSDEDEAGIAGLGPVVEPKPARPAQPRNLVDTWHYGGFDSDAESGLAGWDDFEGVPQAARSILADAAGIEPPSSALVLQMLAVYLVVLVPLNYVVFRSIGRVEYAWVAVPIIALVGAAMVIRLASLDIGFSRSNIQIGLLELHAGHDRGHLTEYAALYTSLATNYQVDMRDNSAQVLPFPTRAQRDAEATRRPSEVSISRTNRSQLDGFQITSNSTDMLHMEEMVDMGGDIRFEINDDQSVAITNGMKLDLKNAMVVGTALRDGKLVRLEALVGDLPADSKKEVALSANSGVFETYQGSALFANTERKADQLWDAAFGNSSAVPLDRLKEIPEVADNWDRFLTKVAIKLSSDSDAIARNEFVLLYQELNPSPRVTLGGLLDLIDGALELTDGAFRLYASTAEKVGGNRVAPEANQTDRQTLVVVHLTRPRMPMPARDANALEDLNIKSDVDYEREMNLFSPGGENDPTESEPTNNDAGKQE